MVTCPSCDQDREADDVCAHCGDELIPPQERESEDSSKLPRRWRRSKETGEYIRSDSLFTPFRLTNLLLALFVLAIFGTFAALMLHDAYLDWQKGEIAWIKGGAGLLIFYAYFCMTLNRTRLRLSSRAITLERMGLPVPGMKRRLIYDGKDIEWVGSRRSEQYSRAYDNISCSVVLWLRNDEESVDLFSVEDAAEGRAAARFVRKILGLPEKRTKA